MKSFTPPVRYTALSLAALGVGLSAGLLLSHNPGRAARPPAAAPPGERGEPDRVRLPKLAAQKNAIETTPVIRTRLARDLEVVGSVAYDKDHYAQIGPLIAGRIVAVRAGIGEKVRVGQVLAELESAEVGQAQATYLAARATARAAEANLARERELAERRVSSQREKELAEAQAATEQAQLSAAIGRLRALGLRQEDIQDLHQDPAARRAGRVPLVAPISGTVLTRQITLGQAVQPASDAFTVANLTRLWVLLDLFEKDLAHVQVGQRAEVRTDAYPGKRFPARVAYVGHEIDEKTRTAPVRIEFDNTEGLLRAGQFVTATLHGDPDRATAEVLAVPRRAVLTIEGRPLCFVAESDGSFSRRPVELGASGGGLVEIRGGLRAGESVAADGSFLLKSELLR